MLLGSIWVSETPLCMDYTLSKNVLLDRIEPEYLIGCSSLIFNDCFFYF